MDAAASLGVSLDADMMGKPLSEGRSPSWLVGREVLRSRVAHAVGERRAGRNRSGLLKKGRDAAQEARQHVLAAQFVALSEGQGVVLTLAVDVDRTTIGIDY